MEMTKTEMYRLGMQAINDFYAMLYKAMKEAMPTAQLSKNGAYVWRGYQINRYEDLASNQYYCQIYPSETGESRELIFQEAYKDPSLKPFDGYEKMLRIKTGDYCYPFRVSLDLYRARFFLLDVNEQLTLLKNFVSYASQQALIWQHSHARPRVTNPKFLNGDKPRTSKPKIPDQFQKVEIEFLDAWEMQHNLFKRLITQLKPFKPQMAKAEKDWIRANSSYYNFDFRGYRMKSGKISPEDYDIRWLIYFMKPEFLSCYTSKKELVEDYNLIYHNYFDLPEDQQNIELTSFVKRCLDRF